MGLQTDGHALEGSGRYLHARGCVHHQNAILPMLPLLPILPLLLPLLFSLSYSPSPISAILPLPSSLSYSPYPPSPILPMPYFSSCVSIHVCRLQADRYTALRDRHLRFYLHPPSMSPSLLPPCMSPSLLFLPISCLLFPFIFIYFCMSAASHIQLGRKWWEWWE